MKKLALIALVFVALGASAQQDTLKSVSYTHLRAHET